MKLISNFSLFISFTILVSFTGCVKDLTNTVYNGPDLVEFYPTSKTVTTTTAPRADSILVQLVGRQRNSPINVTFTVNSTSTALPAEYSITTPSPVVIPANSSNVWIKFTLNKVSTRKTLLIDLTGGDNVSPSANFKTFTYTLQ